MSTVRLGDHELLIRLASGGAANVFLVRDLRAPPPGRLLALKILLPSLASNEDFLKMFFAEAKLAASLRHPNVVAIAGFGQVDGIHCLAMEYVFGASLAQVLRASARAKKPLTVGVLLRITADVCDALHYAHEMLDEAGQPMGVVHRDVTPQNILVGFNGLAKLTDFGIAKATNRGWETQAGIVKGKFSYMSPEQALGKKVDRRSDIFGTGIVLWEALTGRDLFKGSTPMEVLTAIREQKIEPPSKVVDGLTPIVDPIVMKALRRQPKQRYQTAAEMRDEIEDLIRRAGVEIDAQTISREFAAIYGDEIVDRAFALRAAMAGKPDLEALAKILGGALLNPKHLPIMIPGGINDPDPLGLFSQEFVVVQGAPESGPSNNAMPARSDMSGSPPPPPDDFEIDVEDEGELAHQEIARFEMEPEEAEPEPFGPDQMPYVPQERAISGWDDSTSMAIPGDDLLSMLSEEDATVGYLPPEFADRFGAELKKALDENPQFDDEATVGITEAHLAQLRALKTDPKASGAPWDDEPIAPKARSLRPIPRAPSLDLEMRSRSREERPVPRAPSLDLESMTPLPDIDDAPPPPPPPPPPPRKLSGKIEEEKTGPSLSTFSPSLLDVTPLLPEDDPVNPSMPGESVIDRSGRVIPFAGFDPPPEEETADEGNGAVNAIDRSVGRSLPLLDPLPEVGAFEVSTGEIASPAGANLDDSVLLDAANPLSPDALRALVSEPSESGQTPPPPVVLPAPITPGIPQRAIDPSQYHEPIGYTPAPRSGIRLTPTTLIFLILGLIGMGVAIGLLLAR